LKGGVPRKNFLWEKKTIGGVNTTIGGRELGKREYGGIGGAGCSVSVRRYPVEKSIAFSLGGERGEVRGGCFRGGGTNAQQSFLTWVVFNKRVALTDVAQEN